MKLKIAEQIRCSIESNRINYENTVIKVAASMGIAVGSPNNLETVIRQGDDCLYEAKNCGRNRIVSAIVAESE